jgi:hypothetical protein
MPRTPRKKEIKNPVIIEDVKEPDPEPDPEPHSEPEVETRKGKEEEEKICFLFSNYLTESAKIHFY